MSIVNFAVPKALENKVNKAIREKGFASKAEFWRSLATNYLDENMQAYQQARTKYLIESISRLVDTKFRGKKIPSLDKQLADI
ncbi:MAG TPA: hypothetical protein VJI73_04750 [Candidatus Paceibacterota bacterium]